MGKNINIIISFLCLFFAKIKLDNYISLKFKIVDDCVREISISGRIIFGFTPPTLYDCDFQYQNIYPEYFIKNLKYEFGKEIKFIFQDSNHIDGFMDITVYFNEYTIKVTDQKFWRCIDCQTNDNNYAFYNNRLNFYYQGKGDKKIEPKNYTFIFQINSLDDVRNNIYESSNDYYAFKYPSFILILEFIIHKMNYNC